MLGSLLGTGLKGVGLGAVVVAVVVLVLGLVALIRCDRKDIAETVRAFASWWGRKLVRPLRGLTSVSLPFLLPYLSDEGLGTVGVDRGYG